MTLALTDPPVDELNAMIHRKRVHVALAAALVAVLVLGLAACGGASPEPDPEWERDGDEIVVMQAVSESASEVQTIYVRNRSTRPMRVLDAKVSCRMSVAGVPSESIAPGDSAAIQVQHVPSPTDLTQVHSTWTHGTHVVVVRTTGEPRFHVYQLYRLEH